MAVEIPHLDLPFRFVGLNGVAGARVVEQDSSEDVLVCIQSILRFTQGERTELPEFGLPSLPFVEGDIDTDEIKAIVEEWEDRATAEVTQEIDLVDTALRLVKVQTEGGNIDG